jgi:uncharacterized membrane protein
MGLDWIQFSLLDWLAIPIFLICWLGYTPYAINRSRKHPALSKALDIQRKQWMLNAVYIYRAETPRDILSVGIFERSVAFFASTSLVIVAGLLTVIGNSEKVANVLASMHFISDVATSQIQLKILLLILIFVYAFFKFCWSMRCYSFLTTMLGAIPVLHDTDIPKELPKEVSPKIDSWAERAAGIMSSAAHHFNLGLRAYYFALAVLAWFVHPGFFILANLVVVGVLYRRDFKSFVLQNLLEDDH